MKASRAPYSEIINILEWREVLIIHIIKYVKQTRLRIYTARFTTSEAPHTETQSPQKVLRFHDLYEHHIEQI